MKTIHRPHILHLPYEGSFHFSQVIAFLKKRALKGVEVVAGDCYARTFRTDGSSGYFMVRDNPGNRDLELSIICDQTECCNEIRDRVRRMFDLVTDFASVHERLKPDPCLSKGMVNGHVPRLPVTFDPFECCVRAVLGQQISVKAATTLASRIAEKAGLRAENGFPQGLAYYFPGPREILQISLEGIGITRSRQKTITQTAQALLDEEFSLDPDQPFTQFHKAFSAIKGIGEWTVNYVAMRGLGMADGFPASDLGIIKALEKEGRRPSKKEILAMAEKWRPYRAYAALCLWNQ